jgi:hypothetical protein
LEVSRGLERPGIREPTPHALASGAGRRIREFPSKPRRKFMSKSLQIGALLTISMNCDRLAGILETAGPKIGASMARAIRLGMVCAGIVSLGISTTTFADETTNQCKARIMETTKLIAITGDAVRDFKSDNDPNSLEVVFLSNPADGLSRVSDDGQVIFLNAASDQEQQDLTLKAFDIRIAKQSLCEKNRQ